MKTAHLLLVLGRLSLLVSRCQGDEKGAQWQCDAVVERARFVLSAIHQIYLIHVNEKALVLTCLTVSCISPAYVSNFRPARIMHHHIARGNGRKERGCSKNISLIRITHFIGSSAMALAHSIDRPRILNGRLWNYSILRLFRFFLCLWISIGGGGGLFRGQYSTIRIGAHLWRASDTLSAHCESEIRSD